MGAVVRSHTSFLSALPPHTMSDERICFAMLYCFFFRVLEEGIIWAQAAGREPLT